MYIEGWTLALGDSHFAFGEIWTLAPEFTFCAAGAILRGYLTKPRDTLNVMINIERSFDTRSL